MKIVILVAMAFLGDVPLPPKAFAYTGMALCEAARKDLAAEVKQAAPEVTLWSECREVTRDVKPQADPKHRDPKSEKKS